jgi:hypothetical protein
VIHDRGEEAPVEPVETAGVDTLLSSARRAMSSVDRAVSFTCA